MSVRPVAFNNADGTHSLACDENGHAGPLAPSAITFGSNIDGTPNLRQLNVPCPDHCGAVSSHPIAEGAAAAAIQELFARQIAATGCPCTQVKPGAALVIAVSHARLEVQRTAGLNRWVAGAIK